MSTKHAEADNGIEKRLWEMADALRGSIDAAEYKHVCLGLIFLKYIARDDGFWEQAIQSMTGTSGRQRVQVDALALYPLPGPPAEFWNKFNAFVSPLFVHIEIKRRESRALAAQRDALLPGLVSGELQIDFGWLQ